MTHTLQFKQSGDLAPSLLDPAVWTRGTGTLVGEWLNTDPDTKGIVAIVIEEHDGYLRVGLRGAGDDGPIEWPAVRATPLANFEEEAGQRALALAAEFDLGFMKADAYFRVNKGVLVIVLFVTFQDGSGRSNYLNREFFYRRTYAS
jgi:hypothetical protein